jgi:hypothetical protein
MGRGSILPQLMSRSGFNQKKTNPQRPSGMIQDQTMMATIGWNPLGFNLVESLPKGRICHAEYSRDHIL